MRPGSFPSSRVFLDLVEVAVCFETVDFGLGITDQSIDHGSDEAEGLQ